MKSIIQVNGTLNANVYKTINSKWVSADDFNAIRIDYRVQNGTGIFGIQGSNEGTNQGASPQETYLIVSDAFVGSFQSIQKSIVINTKFRYYRVNVSLYPSETSVSVNIDARFYTQNSIIKKCINATGVYSVEEFDTLDFKMRNDGSSNVDVEVRISYYTSVGTAFEDDDVIMLKSDTDTVGKVIDIRGISHIFVEKKNNPLTKIKIEGLLY